MACRELACLEQKAGLKDPAGNVTESRQAALALRAGGGDIRMFPGTDHLTDVEGILREDGAGRAEYHVRTGMKRGLPSESPWAMPRVGCMPLLGAF